MKIDDKIKKAAKRKMSDAGWFVTGGGSRSKRKAWFLKNFGGPKENFKPTVLIIEN